MELHLVIEGRKDLSGQIYRQLAAAIRSGRLAHGQQLPPSRLLAQQLGISRKPVAGAYARLTYEHLLNGQTGKGSFVCAPAPSGARPLSSAELAGHATVRKWDSLPTPLRHPAPEGRSRFEFIGGTPAPHHFPHDEWRRCLLYGLRQERRAPGSYGPTEGVPELREAIARHVGFSRGVRCGIQQVVVTNGAQQAFDLLGRVLLEAGSVVAVEDPGYPLVRLLFQSQGARVVGVPVDAEGIVVELIPDDARLIYVTPAHQFPLGLPMNLTRRKALLARAQVIGAVIIEDDYDSEFRYEGTPNDSLQSLDTAGIVAFVGSFSKIMLPELRIGYLIAPPAVLNAVLTAKHLTDWHTASLIQFALARFIDDTLLLKHIRRGHAIYASRREQLLAAFAGPLAPWFSLVSATAGFHLAARATAPIDIAMLIRLARRADVGLYSLADFFQDSAPEQGLFLGYGAIDTLDIEPALLRVRDILQQMA